MKKESKADNKKNLLISLGVCSALFFIISMINPSIYILNDDLMIQSILSGSFFRPSPYTYCLSIELGEILFLFYYLFPNVPWLGLFFVIIFLSVFVLVSYKLLNIFNSLGKRRMILLIIILSVFMCVFYPNEIMLTFTVVAAVSLCGGIFFILTSERKKDIFFSFVYFSFAYFIREDVFFMGIPFIIVSIIYVYKNEKNFFMTNYLKMIILFALIIVGLFVFNKFIPCFLFI